MSGLKNSITPRMVFPLFTGNAKAPWMPSEVARVARGKFVSEPTSSIHAGAPVDQTLPGKPCPNFSGASADLDLKVLVDFECLRLSTHFRTSSVSSTVHSEPAFQSSSAHIASI